MSVNQSRGDKNEPPQYRRSGRSGNPASQRNFSGGGGGKGGAGGGSTTAPPSSSFYSGKSFKKVVSNAQGAQTRVTGSNPNVNSEPSNSSIGGRAAQNGAHFQPPSRGTADAILTGPAVKPTDASIQKSTPGLPKAPQSNAVAPGSAATSAAGPATPVKGSADASRAFPLQFGSISPGVMNGMQVPARTNSAPPNLDEQKRAQARLDSLKATSFQNPAIPKQQLPMKDASGVDQSTASEPQPIAKEKDVLPPSATPTSANHSQKPSGPPIPPIPGVSMQMPFHKSQLHLQFGGPNMQSQGMAPHPMHLSVGNPSQVQQQVFVPGLQHHPLASQGIIHQNQGLTFSSQMVPPQLGNMGMGLGPGAQYPQHIGNFGGTRRAVKITHPDTHEELRLDKRTDGYANGGSGPRSHTHGPPQSQAIPSFPPTHPMNYYPNSFNTGPIFYPPPNSNPLTSAQPTSGSQAPRFYNQVTVKPAVVGARGEKVGDSLTGGSTAIDKSEIPKIRRPGGEGTSTHPRKESETIIGSSLSPFTTTSTPLLTKPATVGSGSFRSENLIDALAPVEDSTSFVNITDNTSGSFKEEQKKSSKKGPASPVDQSCGLSAPLLSAPESGVQETSKPSTPSLGSNENVPETNEKPMPASVDGPMHEVVRSKERSEDVDQNEDTTGSDVSAIVNKPGSLGPAHSGFSEPNSSCTTEPQQQPVNNKNIDKETSLPDLGSSHDDHQESVTVSVHEASLSSETGLISPSSSGSVDKTGLEMSKAKGNLVKGKKKLKVILKNADAQGTTSDLYNAYKRPEEKKESLSEEIVDGSSENAPEPALVDSSDEKWADGKFEPDDWEDVVDNSTPELESSDNGKRVRVGPICKEDNDGMTKKYSRDFLLKFCEPCMDLPEGFEITSDIAELFGSNNVHREPYPSPGRPVDRTTVGPRLDRRLGSVGDDDKWSKVPGPIGHPGNLPGFRPNYGVLRNPRGPTAAQYAGGILAGPIPSPGGMQRNNSDSDRWQRGTGYHKGLIPSPQTPIPVMHKAEKKYEIGKVTDEEQAKQRQLKGILNKLTPQNFEKLFDQVKQVKIDNAGTLSGVIAQIFDKALMEPTFVEMYANFCSHLAVELPDFSEDNEKITFKRLLLNKCQEEFERGEREEQEANRNEEEGEVKQTNEEREEKRVKARRRMLGNIRLIGELYKKKMLTERIMHECIKKLLGQYQNPDEEDIEALCKLMSTIGEMIDHPKAKEHMDVYFDMMFKLSNNTKLSSRVRFMLKDVIDLRKNRWQQRRKVEGPKKIEEVHRDAAQERQAQSNRLARGSNPNLSVRRVQPVEFGPRGSNAGGFRGLTQPLRGFGNQDARFEERHAGLVVPVRPMSDESITLGPQGGLARGMSVRGMPVPLHEMANSSDSRRPVAGPNGYGSTGYSPRDDLGSRYVQERFAPPPAFDQSNLRTPGRNFDRVLPTSPPPQGQVPTPPQGSSDKVLSEDRLHDLSINAIKEFYSARDEKEVGVCIKELNTPDFYPSLISIWVTDSFERKDMERDLLAKLLINLTKSQDRILTQDSLVRGFQSVLSTLEDAVNDAPKAGEFLGRMLSRIVLENVIPYKQVSRLIYEGGEEQGRLVEIGLAAEVIGVVLEIVKSEKGDSFLNDLCAGSEPRLENFRPANIKKSLRLDKFL